MSFVVGGSVVGGFSLDVGVPEGVCLETRLEPQLVRA